MWFQPFPDAIAGWRVRADFRLWLWVYKARRDMGRLNTEEQGGAAEWLSRFLGIAKAVFIEVPPLNADIIRGVAAFSNGSPWPPCDAPSLNERDMRCAKTFDFEHDAGVIAASFRQVYGIDLRRWEGHWLEFLELLRGLPAWCALGELIRLRAFDLEGLPPGSRIRGRMAAAQRAAALPADDSDGDRTALLAEAEKLFYDS